jgi:hypothetical protein
VRTDEGDQPLEDLATVQVGSMTDLTGAMRPERGAELPRPARRRTAALLRGARPEGGTERGGGGAEDQVPNEDREDRSGCVPAPGDQVIGEDREGAPAGLAQVAANVDDEALPLAETEDLAAVGAVANDSKCGARRVGRVPAAGAGLRASRSDIRDAKAVDEGFEFERERV